MINIKFIALFLPLLIILLILFELYRYNDSMTRVRGLPSAAGIGMPYRRFINLKGEPVSREVINTRFIDLKGEPAGREVINVNPRNRNILRYEGLIVYLSFGECDEHRIVAAVDIYTTKYRVGGRGRVGVGSTRDEVERAFRERRTARVVPDIVVLPGFEIAFAVERFIAFNFSFDEDGLVDMVRVVGID